MANIVNRKALFDYYIEEKFEAGLVLQGWEVKSIREGRAQIKEAHVIVRNGELFLLNSHITPLKTASTHEKADPTRETGMMLGVVLGALFLKEKMNAVRLIGVGAMTIGVMLIGYGG